jgi:hypothetical protein
VPWGLLSSLSGLVPGAWGAGTAALAARSRRAASLSEPPAAAGSDSAQATTIMPLSERELRAFRVAAWDPATQWQQRRPADCDPGHLVPMWVTVQDAGAL